MDESALIPITQLTIEQLRQIGLSKEELEEVIELLEIDEENLYYQNNPFERFCFWDGWFYHGFPTIQVDFLTEFDNTFINLFQEKRNQIYELVKNQEWEVAIWAVDTKVSFHFFRRIRHHFSPEKQKELFLEVYVRNEYGFQYFEDEFYRELLSMPTPEEFDVSQSEIKPDKNGYYHIYRGGSAEGYSWSLKKEVAEFFANRFNQNRKILKGKIHISKIKAYISLRNEEEVLVFPEDIELL